MFSEFIIVLFIIQSRYYAKSVNYNEKIKEQYSLLKSMADIYVSTHLIHLKKNTVSEISSKSFIRKHTDSSKGADEQMREIMKNTIVPEMQQSALEFTDLSTISERMGDNKILSKEFLGVHIGWIRAQFVTVGYDEEEQVIDVVFTTLAIDHEKKKEEYLIHISNSDELTGIYNRHAYETDMDKLRKDKKDNLIVVSLDVNGLKYVNDTYGHKAGDALLQGASICTDEVFGKYGKVYRVGGDEFMALIYVAPEDMVKIMNRFEKRIKEENKKVEHQISISCGYASCVENPSLTADELGAIADKKMYEEKARYYHR